MDSVTCGPWRIAVDRAATERAYANISIAGLARCDCAYCRNFAAARDRVYPPEVIDLFARLGINPRYEAELVDYHTVDPNDRRRLMGGWFHFVGTVVEGPGGVYEPLAAGFDVRFTRRVGVVEQAFAGQQIAQVEFLTHVPWVLDEPDPD